MTCALLLTALIGLVPDAPLRTPEGLPPSRTYQVWVDDRPLPVHEAVKHSEHGTHDITRMSYAGFDLDRPVTLRIRHRSPLAGAALRPYAAGIQPTLVDPCTVSFRLEAPAKLVLVPDASYEDCLLLFADPPEAPPTPETVTHYYGPGLHAIGDHLPLASGDRVYLSRGAVLHGSFGLADVNDVRIWGRGVIDGSPLPHQEDYRVLRGDHTRAVRIEGITIVDAPGWIISFWGGNTNLTVRNVKTVGCYRYNSDGVQTGTVGLRVEHCFLQCNDDNLSLNGICQDVTVRDNVLWNLYNGGVFMFGWATGEHFDLRDVTIRDNVILRAGGCCEYDRKAPISLKVFGSGRRLENVTLANLVIEDIAPYGRWLDLQAGQSRDSVLRNITLQNITIGRTWHLEAEIRGAPTSPITDVHITDLTLAGRPLRTATEAGLNLVHTEGVTLDGRACADTVPVRAPAPVR